MIHLETERLVLTPIVRAHEREIHELHTDRLVVHSLFNGIPPSMADTKEKTKMYDTQWKREGFGFFAVFLKVSESGDRKFVGRSGLRHLDKTAEIEHGSCFSGAASGKGISPEAGRAVVRFGFEELGFMRIVAVIRPENQRSLRSIHKKYFRYRGDRWHYGRVMKYFETTPEDYGIERILSPSMGISR